MTTAFEAVEQLRLFALGLPGAFEAHPWGERVVKVNKKVFVFLGMPDSPELHISIKLPSSASDALERPYAKPTGYGLGKAGWVTLDVPPDSEVDLDELKAWVIESYRAVAPKKLLKELDVTKV